VCFNFRQDLLGDLPEDSMENLVRREFFSLEDCGNSQYLLPAAGTLAEFG
jgi:hypothetical protein